MFQDLLIGSQDIEDDDEDDDDVEKDEDFLSTDFEPIIQIQVKD